MATPSIDFAAVKQRQQQVWSAGVFSLVAVPLVVVSEQLCETVDLRAGQHVLDVACGSGNTAIVAARRNTTAVGVDYVQSLLDRARERAQAVKPSPLAQALMATNSRQGRVTEPTWPVWRNTMPIPVIARPCVTDLLGA